MKDDDIEILDKDKNPIDRKPVASPFFGAGAFLLLGILLVLFPGQFMQSICYVIGGIMIAYCAMVLIKHFSERRDGFAPELIIPVAAGIMGLFVIVNSKFIISILPFILGLIFVVSAISALQDGMLLKAAGAGQFKMEFIIAVITLLLGLFLMLDPFHGAELGVRIAGAFFIVNSGFNIYRGIANRNLRK